MFSPARAVRSYRVGVTNPGNPASWLVALMGGERTASGVTMTPEGAMGISTVYASCRNLAEDVGGFPCPIYRRTEGGRVEARYHEAWRIFNDEANPEMSSMTFQEVIVGHAALRGTGFAEKQLGKADQTVALWPLNPAKMTVRRNGADGLEVSGAPDGQLIYDYILPNGQRKLFTPDLIFPFAGFGGNGIEGYSIVRLLAEALGLTAAAEEFGARFFGNDARPGIVLTRPKEVAALSKDARDRMAKEWETAHQPLDKKHRIAILQEGMDLKEVGIPPEEAQFLETRAFQRIELAASFRMPPTKLSDLTHGTYSNTENEDIAYVKWTLRAWTRRLDKAIRRSHIVDDPYYAQHNLTAALQGDSAARADFYQKRMSASSITPNQIADLEDEPRSTNPIADQLLIPLNMVPASALDANGATWAQKMNAVGVLVRGGYDPEDILRTFGLPPIKHTGAIPVTLQIDPSTLTGGQP